MRQSGLTLAAGRVRSKKKKAEKKNTKKSRPTENTPRNPQQPSDDRDHLETDREETRPIRWPIFARFHRYRVKLYGNRPRTALAISTKTTKFENECHT